MAVHGQRVDSLGDGWRRFRIILEMIKIEHTVFALPFALMSLVMASGRIHRGWPDARTTVWVLAAMVGARSAAMAFNRLADARFDAANPRTASRAIPAGVLSASQVGLFTVGSILLFELAAYKLNPLCLALSPVALLAILGYSYTKRFTALSHIVLGFGIGIAPIGAWIAVTGRLDVLPLLLGSVVMLWIGGFDIIYALQDVEFDSRAGLRSLPGSLGKQRALLVSRLMHVAMLGLLIAIGVVGGLHLAYFAGVGIAACLIIYEHSIVSADDLSRVNIAFFTLNGWIGVILLGFVLLDRLFAA